MNKIDIHRMILNTLHDTYRKKNADYDDSAGKLYDEFGPVSLVVRMNDKMNRINNLVKGHEANVIDEKMIDTVLDLSNYCVMLAIELTKHEGGELNGK